MDALRRHTCVGVLLRPQVEAPALRCAIFSIYIVVVTRSPRTSSIEVARFFPPEVYNHVSLAQMCYMLCDDGLNTHFGTLSSREVGSLDVRCS